MVTVGHSRMALAKGLHTDSEGLLELLQGPVVIAIVSIHNADSMTAVGHSRMALAKDLHLDSEGLLQVYQGPVGIASRYLCFAKLVKCICLAQGVLGRMLLDGAVLQQLQNLIGVPAEGENGLYVGALLHEQLANAEAPFRCSHLQGRNATSVRDIWVTIARQNEADSVSVALLRGGDQIV